MRDDDVFHTRVALKILKRGMDTESTVRRFRTERQILAGLDHPNIARLLDAGTTTDGLPYLVMELHVYGEQLDEDVRRHLAGLPVLARHDPIGYRTGKFVRRHRGAVTAAAVFMAFIASVVGIAWQARVARAERAGAEQRFNDVHDAVKDLAGSTPPRQCDL